MSSPARTRPTLTRLVGATIAFGVAAAAIGLSARRAEAARILEFRFTPTAHLQLALWIESADGVFLKTVGLTQAVSRRGIGNRPGASQMNSGFRWPYGRREGVLPVWAHRRASAPGAASFKRVIFQARVEGHASSDVPDSSVDDYFCLSFKEETGKADQSTREKALDAVSCASGFKSDKGRFITQADVDASYWEPIEILGAPMRRPLDLVSLYPPRRDTTPCMGSPSCFDVADPDSYDQHARDVMPDIDAVTMATPAGDVEQSVTFPVPDAWVDGPYVAWIEANKEGDYNAFFNDQTYPTPRQPPVAWDSPWATDYGYPYRGQPSVIYRVDFVLGAEGSFSTAAPVGHGDLGGFGPTGGDLTAIADGVITDDAVAAPGSGADRLRFGADGFRVRVSSGSCPPHDAPGAPAALAVRPDPDAKHSHEWGVLHFIEPESAKPIDHYEARFGASAIVAGDEPSFLRAMPLVTAELDPVALKIAGGATGRALDVHFGGMLPTTTFWIAVRAVDNCGTPGPFVVASLTTTKINFTKLSGCFIATAAFGSALEPEVETLRVARDVLRSRSGVFATATDLYYRSGPPAAATLARSDVARAVVRQLLGPIVAVAAATVPGGPLPGAAP